MQINSPSKISVLGQHLEVLHMANPKGTDAPDIVFLHEGLGSVRLWRDWPAQICQLLGCSAWVYSRQGYGQSDPVPDVRGPSRRVDGQRQGRLLPDYMHREALDVLPALLEALHIRRPMLLGHSDGGTIALLHASQFDVAGCVVMAPHVMVEDVSIHAIQAARDAFGQGPLRQKLSAFHADVEGAFWQWNDVWLSEGFRSFDIRGDLHRISAPLLAIQGTDDPYGTMAQIDDIARAVPHAQLLKLAHCGHAPHRDQPDAVAQALQGFYAALPPIKT